MDNQPKFKADGTIESWAEEAKRNAVECPACQSDKEFEWYDAAGQVHFQKCIFCHGSGVVSEGKARAWEEENGDPTPNEPDYDGADDSQYRQDMKDAGRGHLLK